MKTRNVADERDGFAQRFERRPEFLFFHDTVFHVVDATNVRERAVDDLKVFPIRDVFAGKDEIFLGFGKPNAYLVVPDGKGDYQKFAGKSLKRAPSVVADTKGFVQSGILVRFKNLPPEAAQAIRKGMAIHDGNKYWTCVNACLRVMEDAGFSMNGKKLSEIYLPYKLMKTLLTNELLFNGKPVEYELVRTTPLRLENYTRQIIGAELATFCRHANRSLEGKAKKSKFFAGIAFVVGAPSRLGNRLLHGKPQPRVHAVLAPALPEGEYLNDLHVSVSMASKAGAMLRQVWGPHALFTAEQPRVKAGDYLTETLRAFPQPNPSLVTRIKKRVLFAKPVIWAIRKLLVPHFVDVGLRSENDIYDMLRTHTDATPNKYNIVITRTRIIIARTTVGAKLVDWILSKHVLMSGYDPDVVFAGEVWKDADGAIHLSGNSGTYRPVDAMVVAAVAFLQAVFAHLQVVKD